MRVLSATGGLPEQKHQMNIKVIAARDRSVSAKSYLRARRGPIYTPCVGLRLCV